MSLEVSSLEKRYSEAGAEQGIAIPQRPAVEQRPCPGHAGRWTDREIGERSRIFNETARNARQPKARPDRLALVPIGAAS
jgi:hypothetical protein